MCEVFENTFTRRGINSRLIQNRGEFSLFLSSFSFILWYFIDLIFQNEDQNI